MNVIPPLESLELVFSKLVNSILTFGGLVLFIMLLIGGFKYLTSGGDPKALDGAKKTLTTAIAGLVMLVFSYMILVIISNFTGTPSVVNFQIKKP